MIRVLRVPCVFFMLLRGLGCLHMFCMPRKRLACFTCLHGVVQFGWICFWQQRGKGMMGGGEALGGAVGQLIAVDPLLQPEMLLL